MNVLPFPCLRPAEDHAIEVLSQPVDALASADSILQAQEAGILLQDARPSYYLYENTAASGARQTALIGICALESLVCDIAQNVEAAPSGACPALQCTPAPVTYKRQPVLDVILSAAQQGAPLYDLYDPAGARHRIWHIGRTEAVEAIRTMVQQVPSVSDASSGVLTSMVNHAETVRAQSQATGTYTGREPFNYVLLALYPTDGAKTALPAMPVGFLAHQIAKL